MSSQNEVFYEYVPDKHVNVEKEEPKKEKPTVSFISDDVQGRVLQQAFSICPRTDSEGLKDRYNRLHSELTLLHERIEYENQKSAELQHQFIDDIQTYLSALKNVSAENSKSDAKDPLGQRVAALSNRIAALEWTLGIGQQPSPSTQPLLQTIEDLKVRISLLTPELLTRINKRLQENFYEAKSARSDVSNESLNLARDDKNTGISEMYELIKNWDTSCKELPNIINHLSASRQLHEDAERVCRKYDKFVALKAEVQKSLQFLRAFDELNAKQNEERMSRVSANF
ncbi:hypothetical protein M3Y97_00287800 [Aphelenchoides bicaudatus]|nr:hypothetical protein M3Y97_00287800 [Aphelenchoides bicaudatus]